MTRPYEEHYHQLRAAEGVTFHRAFQWVDDGVIMDITGAEIAMQVREPDDRTILILDASITNGKIEILHAETGVFSIKFLAEELIGLGGKRGFYDILIKIGDDIFRILTGDFVIEPTMTETFFPEPVE